MHSAGQVALKILEPLSGFDTIYIINQLLNCSRRKKGHCSLNSVCGIKQTYSEDPIHDRLYLLQTLVRILVLGELNVIVCLFLLLSECLKLSGIASWSPLSPPPPLTRTLCVLRRRVRTTKNSRSVVLRWISCNRDPRAVRHALRAIAVNGEARWICHQSKGLSWFY